MAVIKIKESSIIRKGFYKLNENDHLQNGRYTLIKITDLKTNKTYYEIIHGNNIKKFNTLEEVKSFLEIIEATGTEKSIKDANDYIQKSFPIIADEELTKEAQLALKKVKRNKLIENDSIKSNPDNPKKNNPINEIKLTKNYKLKRYNEINIALFKKVETKKIPDYGKSEKWKALRYYPDFEQGLEDAIKYLNLKKISLFNLCQSLKERHKSIEDSQELDKKIMTIKEGKSNWQHIVYGGHKKNETGEKIKTLNLSSEDK